MKKHATYVIILVCLASMKGFGRDDHTTSALQSLVNTERAFATRCSEIGVRASFLEFFTDDGIAFYPKPVVYREAIKERPAPANPLAISLKWEPQVAGIASSGDLGYTTGPSIWADATGKDSSKYYGQFFSVWKKERDGAWKVVVDIGIETPTPASPLGQPCSEIMEPTGCHDADDSAREEGEGTVPKLEREFGNSCQSVGAVQAYLDRTDTRTRLHRERSLPVVGGDAIKGFLSTETRVPNWSPAGNGISSAGDLGYSYGSYELRSADDSAPSEKGYYLHVWRCDGEGRWKLVVDVAKPEPPAEGK